MLPPDQQGALFEKGNSKVTVTGNEMLDGYLEGLIATRGPQEGDAADDNECASDERQQRSIAARRQKGDTLCLNRGS